MQHHGGAATTREKSTQMSVSQQRWFLLRQKCRIGSLVSARRASSITSRLARSLFASLSFVSQFQLLLKSTTLSTFKQSQTCPATPSPPTTRRTPPSLPTWTNPSHRTRTTRDLLPPEEPRTRRRTENRWEFAGDETTRS